MKETQERPEVDKRSTVLNFRCPTYQVERFERYVETMRISKSDALREALAVWLNLNTPKEGQG